MSLDNIYSISEKRIRTVNNCSVNPKGSYVLYWMITSRRLKYNHALQRCLEYAFNLKKPILILEALRIDYQYASDRLHRFIIDGMNDNFENIIKIKNPGVIYYPYLELKHREGSGLLKSLSENACAVITDDYPCFFIPNMIKKAGSILTVKFEAVDSNGLLPYSVATTSFTTALSFRGFLQKNLKAYLTELPLKNPLLTAKLPKFDFPIKPFEHKWPTVPAEFLSGDGSELSGLDIDHTVPAVNIKGGSLAGEKLMLDFMERKLRNYVRDGSNPELDCRSNLSPYLHFGHISVYEIFDELARRQNWSENKIGKLTNGRRNKWWGMDENAEIWLDELVTWRELGFNLMSTTSNHDNIDILPNWALATLQKHSTDKRERIYTLEELTKGITYDHVWNVAQRQLLTEGRIHNYLRMVWGKRIIEWTTTPQQALDFLLHLNNRFALDGRDPNSYTGCLWVLGLFDRAWGPERPIYGTIRYMSSENTIKKFKLKNFMGKLGGDASKMASLPDSKKLKM